MWIVEETNWCFVALSNRSLSRQLVGPQRPGDSDGAFIVFKFHGSRFPGKLESRHFFLVLSKGAVRYI